MFRFGKPAMRLLLLTLAGVMLLQGCASVSPRFEQPTVEVLSLKMLPSAGLEQRFDVGLKVVNPNNRALNIRGMSYSLIVEGFTVASGVTADVPEVGPYAEARFTLPASTSLVSSVRLLKHLLELNASSLSYRLEARLDLGIPLTPKMRVVEEGKVELVQFQ